MQEIYHKIIDAEAVKQSLVFIQADHLQTIKEQKEICATPAPPFAEKERALDYMRRFSALGLKNVHMDNEGNVFGTRPGSGCGPKVILAAHLDTVFPEGTDTVVKERDGKLYAPGIGDDSRGLAAILSVVRALNESNIKTIGDIIFCGNVGEEGLGDLRGVKAIFREMEDIAGFISLDGEGSHTITYLATGSRRFKVTYKGPGGHSFSAFGLPSAIHALGRAIAEIADLEVPKEPKTTFTVGMIDGGTSVNSIAYEASMLVDMRSTDQSELNSLEERVLKIVNDAASLENERWHSNQLTVETELVGDRPAGAQSKDAQIVQAAWQATKCIGEEPELCFPSSTDANLPISLKIPAITIGPGGKSGGAHSLGEWFDPSEAYKGPQRAYLIILGLVGIEGISEPLLKAEI